MPQKTKRLPNRRKRKAISNNKKSNAALAHTARSAKLIRSVCCCGPIYMTPNRSRFQQLVKYLQCITLADMHKLEGYEFSPCCKVRQQVNGQIKIHHDYNNEYIYINFPENSINTCPDSTHCRLILVAATMDFSNYNATMKSERSLLMPADGRPLPAFELSLQMPSPHSHPLFLILGMSYINMATAEVDTPQMCHAVSILKVTSPPLFLNPAADTKNSILFHHMNDHQN